MAYLIGYKAPHKLTLSYLRSSLQDLDISEVVKCLVVPKKELAEETASFNYWAKKLTAAALAQTFHYMIEGGLEYSFLTTGEAMVFLKVDWADSNTLYYHLAEPERDTVNNPANLISYTAVTQILAFTLMALGSPEKDKQREQPQDVRLLATQKASRWELSVETILGMIPETARKTSESPSEWASSTKQKKRKYKSPSPNRLTSQRDRSRSPSDNSPSAQAAKRRRASRTFRGKGTSHEGTSSSSSSSRQQNRSYCTQASRPRYLAPSRTRAARANTRRRSCAPRQRGGTKRHLQSHPPPIRIHICRQSDR